MDSSGSAESFPNAFVKLEEHIIKLTLMTSVLKDDGRVLSFNSGIDYVLSEKECLTLPQCNLGL